MSQPHVKAEFPLSDVTARIIAVAAKVHLEKYGDTISNLQRMILIREGRNLPADDYPREYLFEEPISGSPESPEVMVPGPGETVVNIAGRKLDREKYTQVLQEYYRLRGWDEDAGVPL